MPSSSLGVEHVCEAISSSAGTLSTAILGKAQDATQVSPIRGSWPPLEEAMKSSDEVRCEFRSDAEADGRSLGSGLRLEAGPLRLWRCPATLFRRCTATIHARLNQLWASSPRKSSMASSLDLLVDFLFVCEL